MVRRQEATRGAQALLETCSYTHILISLLLELLENRQNGENMKKCSLLMVVAWICMTLNAAAMINPNFTPIDLVEGADTIMVLTPSQPDAKKKVAVKIQRVIKGEAEKGDTWTIDFSEAPEEDFDEFLKILKTLGDDPVLLFAGEDEQGDQAAFLHISTVWLRMEAIEKTVFTVAEAASHMAGTWAGGTDMFVQLVDYILADDMADVPVHWGAEWCDRIKIDKLTGKIHKILPIDIDGNGTANIYVACDTGDKLYTYDKAGTKFVDITKKRNLVSKSQHAVWADFNGDGRLDLASVESRGVYLQKADGTLDAISAWPASVSTKGCTDIAVLDVGTGAKAGLLLTLPDMPVLLTPVVEVKFIARPLTRGATENLGRAGKSLVADFDGDQIADILQMYEKGSWMYCGKGKGEFLKGKRSNVALGPGITDAATGDYDANGKLDVLCVAEDTPRLWEHETGTEFKERMGLCGSFAYISKPGGIECGTCDINNDGRQDLYVMYGDMYPQIFFNRGYRCFGFSIGLTAGDEAVTPEANNGQQAGLIADLDGDGAQDFVVAQKNGELWFVNRSDMDRTLHVTATLPLKSKTVGPVTVKGWLFDRPLGAWNVTAGAPGAWLGMEEAGECKVKWKLPGNKTKTKMLEVDDKSINVKLK